MRPKVIVLSLIGAIYLFVPLTSYGQELRISILDVGQGDSILIDTPKHHQILIDGGPDQSVIGQLDQVMPIWDRSIDAIVPTHPEADHITGLIAVMQRYQVGRVLATPATKDTVTYAAFAREVQRQQLPVTTFVRGSSMATDDGLTLSSVWPQVDQGYDAVKNVNDVAQVCRLEYQSFSALFTADAGADIEDKLADLGDTQPVTLLKIPHHGSKTGMDPTYIKALHPRLAVVSVGAKNRYGHPAASIGELMHQVGARYYRTDQNGRVTITVNQAGISLKTSKIAYNAAQK